MATNRIIPVILSGGSGTRLWPVSRADHPKQLQPLTGTESLLQQTAARVTDPDRFGPAIFVCNDDHRFVVAEQLRDQGIEAGAIILEPVGRNTAPAIAVAAFHALKADPTASILVLPSDHLIADRQVFAAMIDQALLASNQGHLVTFGIVPKHAETGYGYIEAGTPLAGTASCRTVTRFTEKPGDAAARTYLESGRHYWNSGMFLFSARLYLDELKRFQPAVFGAARAAVDAAGCDLDFVRLAMSDYLDCPSISVDYAVMEHTQRAAVVPVEGLGWSDVGSWNALWEVAERDGDGNARQGDVVSLETTNSYLRSDGRLLVTVGVSDLVVVATPDAVLVVPRDKAQALRQAIDALHDAGRPEQTHHPRVERPWGSYESVDADAGFQVKRLIVKPGAALSLQRHRHRSEHWVVVRGTARVTRDDDVFDLAPSESTFIRAGQAHRLANPGDEALHVIEVQSGDYLGEDDIERFADDYGRAEDTARRAI